MNSAAMMASSTRKDPNRNGAPENYKKRNRLKVLHNTIEFQSKIVTRFMETVLNHTLEVTR